MTNEAEFCELKKICKERKITPETLLEEKVASFQDKISDSQGELIGALTRNYEQCSSGVNPVYYSIKETLYTGIITPETRFPLKGNHFGGFLLGINNPFSLELGSTCERDFEEKKDGQFGNYLTDYFLLYFIDKPALVPEDSYKLGCFGGRYSTMFPTKKPRLELYIGNNKVIPFLQQQLEGWRYTQLSKLLNYDLPITNEIAKRIEKEQLEIFDGVRETETACNHFIKEKKDRIEIAKTGGVIYHGTHIELTDEVVENLRYNPQIKESRDKVVRLLKKAIKRGYHENGMAVSKKIDEGVVTQINLKDFFSHRMRVYSELL